MNDNKKQILKNFVKNDTIKKTILRLLKYINFGINIIESIKDSYTSNSVRNKEFNSLLADNVKKLQKKNVPNSDKYPYTVHDNYIVFPASIGYEKYFLVGDSWLEKNSEKPIALLIGFNNWKYGFVADYLQEYRVIFAPRKLLYISSKINPKPDVIVVWGYTENRFMCEYAKKNSIPLYRMEDGFIRSALLGASHATPYSLILDKKGLYYNPETETDLDNILNNYDFKEDKNLLKEAESSLKLIIDMKISKYNTPTTSKIDKFGIKIKKRVAVLGQVDGDAAMIYGNPDKWTSEDLIKLAKLENPEAEVLYRPHPEVYKGYQKSKFKQRRIEHFAKVVSPKEPLLEFLENIDHVYVVNSLSGLEALLRGVKVTTVGAAFYAGWGLTDDRCKIDRRDRTLSLVELFAGIYLKYPRYLANLHNSYMGLKAAVYRIKADTEIAKFDSYKELDIDDNMLSSYYWVQLIFSANLDKKLFDTIFDKIDFTIYLKNGASLFFQKIYILSLFGLLNDNKQKALFLSKVRIHIDCSVYNEFLTIVSKVYEETLLVKEIAWLLNQDINIKISSKLLEIFNLREEQYNKGVFTTSSTRVSNDTNVKQLDINKLQDALSSEIGSANYENVLSILTILDDIELDDIESVKQNIQEDIFNFYEYYMNEKEFDKAIKLAEIMLIFGLHTQTLISKLVNYAKLRFDFQAVIQLAKLNQNINLYAQNRNITLTEMMAYGSNDIVNIGKNQFDCYLAKLITLKPNAITSASFIVDKYKCGEEKENFIAILESLLYLDNEQSIRKAQAFIAINQAEKSVAILENLIEIQETTPNLICAYTQALSFADRVDEAIEHIERALKQYLNKDILHEAIRLYVLANTYKKCLNILNIAKNNNIELGEMYLRKTYFGNRMPGKALETFLYIPPKKNIYDYYKIKYFNILSKEKIKFHSITILSIFGPGDEMRFASIYNLLRKELNIENITITCSPKLNSLFNRSFNDLKFISSEKLRDSDFDFSTEFVKSNYSNVLGFDLLRSIDNNGADAINKSDKVVMITDLLHKILPNYESFSGKSYLLANMTKTKEFKKLLPTNTKLVGLSWRSSLTTHSRNEHYLTIEELSPLFEIEGITFVNFQYDECSNELNWVEKNYPGKMIDIEEVDHYDDLDSVASLMKCMDLIIAPATTVVELAGALGCPTWMFSNSSEIDWRIIDDEGTDVWHNSVKIIEGDIPGDKVSLVQNLKTKLERFIG